jgi:Na+/alanine symporter
LFSPEEDFQMKWKAVLFALAAMAPAGCSSTREFDVSQSNAITSDIEATHQTSPSVITRGQRLRDEPDNGLPWQLRR